MDKIGPKHRTCRRVGEPLCGRPNCPSLKRPYPPGQHGRGRKRISEYQTRLVEKQKLRAIYGVSESQMRRYYDQASRSRSVTGEEMIRSLETRLDTVVLRLGLRAHHASGTPAGQPRPRAARRQATERPERAREARADDRDQRQGQELRLGARSARDHGRPARPTSTGTRTRCQGTLSRLPERDEVPLPVKVDERLIVEFYS